MDIRPPVRDACTQCLTDAGLAHGRYPLRRIVLGPLPVETVSSGTLLRYAKEQHDDLDSSAVPRHHWSIHSPLLSSRHRRAFSGLSPARWTPVLRHTPRLRRTRSTGSLSEFASPAPEGGAAALEPPLPGAAERSPVVVPPDVPEDAVLSLSPERVPSPTDLPEEASAPPTPRATSPGAALPPHGRRRRAHSSAASLGGSVQSPPRRAPPPRLPSSLLHSRPAVDPLRTASYFSSHSVPPPPPMHGAGDAVPLDPALRQELELRLSYVVGHHRMVGDTFVVGDVFWETLQHETSARPPSAATTPCASPSNTPHAHFERSRTVAEDTPASAPAALRRGERGRSATLSPVPARHGSRLRIDEGSRTAPASPVRSGPASPADGAALASPADGAALAPPAEGVALAPRAADAGAPTTPVSVIDRFAPLEERGGDAVGPYDAAAPDYVHYPHESLRDTVPGAAETRAGAEQRAPHASAADAASEASAATFPAEGYTPRPLPRSADRPARLRPILRVSHGARGGSARQASAESGAIESRQGWDKTRARLFAKPARAPLRLGRSAVMQQLEAEMQGGAAGAVPKAEATPGAAPKAEAPRAWMDEHAALPRGGAAAKGKGASAPSSPVSAPRVSPATPSSGPAPGSASGAGTASAPLPSSPASLSSGSLESIPADADVASLTTPRTAVPSRHTRSASQTTSLQPIAQAGEALLREPRALFARLRAPSERRVRLAVPSLAPTRSDELLEVDEAELPARLVARGEAVPVGAGDAAPPQAEQVLARETEPPLPVAPVQRVLHERAEEQAGALHAVLSPVLQRDRMLVKIQHAPHQNVAEAFNALEARRYDLRSFRFAEYMVVLRPQRLELWSEATVRGRVLGHTARLKLRHVVHLERGAADVSMYSEIDGLFSVTCPRRLHRQSRTTRQPLFRRHGSVILIFAARTATTAEDWMWLLYRELGGPVPEHLYVHIPSLSVRIRVPVPALPVCDAVDAARGAPGDSLEAAAQWAAAASLSSGEMIRSVVRLVRAMPNWAQLAEQMVAHGMQPKLAWRSGAMYNWVPDEPTPAGRPRFWAVLVGRLFAWPGRQPVLEMVPSKHYPTTAWHPNGTRLAEPPALEGVVWRVRAVSGAMSRVYFFTQESRIYMTRVARAFAPDVLDGVPLDTALETPSMTRTERLAQHAAAFHAREQARQQLQVRYCDGFVDLREVCAIRCVGTGVTVSTELTPTARDMTAQVYGDAAPAGAVPDTHVLYDYDGTRARLEALFALPDDDGGRGADGLHAAPDRARALALRQVDLLMANGRRVSFACASAALAREWMVRLYQLAVYWACRRRSDVWLLSKLESYTQPRTATGVPHADRYTDELSLYSLGVLWNWCVMDGCRAARHSGWLFWKTEHSHNYTMRFFALCGGALVPFKRIRSVRTAASRQNEGVLYRRLEPPIVLRDAYVYTGNISDRIARSASGDGTGPARRDRHLAGGSAPLLPRLYPDGFTSYDHDHDCLFALRVRTGNDALSAEQNLFRLRHRRPLDTGEYIPGLAEKTYGEILFRARSVVDRDLWIRAIEVEIEHLARSEPEREAIVRERGEIA
ncbi:hypothetical protein MBRA1_003416 [Malassezia brasiliensis]|uniref:PH domain-containing protein n=1 Tax=Malassezia brasiliensis TaxID=1821822 RepID=A0AAF0DW36_9BASI|nr:hypothetical protein MBRA1_003416 [Malassezia brasiliensis]